jgi:hypothetical protein
MESVSPGQDFQRIHSLGVLQAQHLSFKNGLAAEEWNFDGSFLKSSVEQ